MDRAETDDNADIAPVNNPVAGIGALTAATHPGAAPMIRTLALPSLQSSMTRLDGKRIAANSTTVAVHVLVFALLLAPLQAPPEPPRARQPERALEVLLPILIPRPAMPPPSTPPRPITRITATPPQPLTPPVAQSEPSELPSLPSDEAPPATMDADVTVDAGVSTGEPALATLAYLRSPPPRYPVPALRAGQQGQVLLRVWVDETGRVQSVTIERSSGYPMLDRAAHQQVRTRWRFQPAQRDGHAIAAIALVPIDFTLPE